ncbi:APC family permease [Ornithinibacillus bavariensis]|uniref:APC family permease n=1 Tax=Ornithinibacillus bavariensis TaxID=545502 RepID=UPI000EBCFBA0|nr:amino acid permease [Ornithinibacillus sp.]
MKERITLKKSYKQHWVWAIALGSSIGWGAFVQPTNWIATAGPVGAMAGFGIGALLMMLIAVSYGFLIRSFPVSGGEFAYAFIGLGKVHAFICGWFLALGYICIVALNASAFALMFKFIFPRFIENIHMYQIAGWDVYGTEIILATFVLLIFGYFNIRGNGFSGKIQFIFCVVMVLSVIILTFLVGVQPEAGLANIHPLFPVEKTALAAIISIIAIAPWAYVGFDNVPQLAEEFSFSSKKAFNLIIIALFFAGLLYILMILATSMALPWNDFISKQLLWGTGTVVKNLLGNFGLIILVIAVSMGIFTGLNGFIVSSSRLLFAMSRAKFVPKIFSKLHPKYNTPYISILFTILISLLAPWFGRQALTWVVDMSSIGVTIAYFYTCFTAYKLFKWNMGPDYLPSLHEISPIKKVLAGIGTIVSILFLGLLLIPGSPAFLGFESRVALAIWILLGIGFYLIKRRDLNTLSESDLNYLILGKSDLSQKNS